MGGGQARLRNGKLAVISPEALHDLQEVLRDCDPGQPQPGVYRMRKSQGAYLDATFERWGAAIGPSWEKWRARSETSFSLGFSGEAYTVMTTLPTCVLDSRKR